MKNVFLALVILLFIACKGKSAQNAVAVSQCDSVVQINENSDQFNALQDIRIYDKALEMLSVKQTQTQRHFILERKETGVLYEMKFEKNPQDWHLIYYFVNAC